MKITVNDRQSYAVTRREYTDEGFLRVPGRVARTGIQDYLASELQLTDRKPNDIIKIYRPSEEVFNSESLDTYLGADITVEHPNKMVDSSTYKITSVGVVRSPGRQDGDFVVADHIIKDKDAIKAVESGKVQLSAGYTAEYDMTPGVTPTGESYDGVQRSIKINHVAIVTRARAGAQARLFDHKGETAMKKLTLDSGREIEVEDSATAALIEDSMNRLQQSVTDAKNDAETKQAVIDAQNAELEQLRAATSDEAITKRVAAVASTLDAARKKVGKDFTCDSVNPVEIQRAALQLVNKDADYTGKSDDYIAGLFDAMSDKEDDDEEETGDAGGRGKQRYASGDSYAALTQDGANTQQTTERKSAYDSHKESLSNAWKGKEK